MYVMDNPTNWEDQLHLEEFAYNNGYQTFTKICPFEISYGQKCSTPMSWDNPVNKVMVGPNLLKEIEQEFNKVRHNWKEAQDKKKIYANLKRKNK